MTTPKTAPATRRHVTRRPEPDDSRRATGTPARAPGTRAAAPGTRLPSRANPRGIAPLQRLFDRTPTLTDAARGGLGRELVRAYDGDLSIGLREARPTVVTNFVSTLDGVVAMDTHGTTGGGEVSGFSPTDRFVMGLLRALADVVLVGASTIRTSGRGAWTPEGVFPDAADQFRELRAKLGLAVAPTTMVATLSGDVSPDLPALTNETVPIVIAAPPEAAERLRTRRFRPSVTIETIPGEAARDGSGLVEVARRLGARLVVSEAGPNVFASLLKASMVDELFLTLAPQIAGRGAEADRLGLIEGLGLWPAMPTWTRLASARVGGDHLFLRYQFEESTDVH